MRTDASTPDMRPLKAFIRDRLPGARLQHEFQEQLTYHVSAHSSGPADGADGAPTLRWSQMFGIMEEARRRFSVEDYALSQTSLEQVFLSFARQQADADTDTAAVTGTWSA